MSSDAESVVYTTQIAGLLAQASPPAPEECTLGISHLLLALSSYIFSEACGNSPDTGCECSYNKPSGLELNCLRKMAADRQCHGCRSQSAKRKAPRRPREPQSASERPERRRAPQSAPDRPKAAQNAPKRHRAPQSDQRAPESTREHQNEPE